MDLNFFSYRIFLFVIAFIYGINDMINGAYSHLTLWTWNLHCISLLLRYLNTIYDINSNFLKNISVSSFIGSYFVLANYLFVLFLNPNLEYDLNEKQTIKKSKFRYWLRSFLLHGVPPIFSVFELLSFKESYKKMESYWLLYLLLPVSHLLIGIIYKYLTKKDDFDAYEIYVNYDNGKSNKYKITKFPFIASTGAIGISTIFGLRYISKKFLKTN